MEDIFLLSPFPQYLYSELWELRIKYKIKIGII